MDRKAEEEKTEGDQKWMWVLTPRSPQSPFHRRDLYISLIPIADHSSWSSQGAQDFINPATLPQVSNWHKLKYSPIPPISITGSSLWLAVQSPPGVSYHLKAEVWPGTRSAVTPKNWAKSMLPKLQAADHWKLLNNSVALDRWSPVVEAQDIVRTLWDIMFQMYMNAMYVCMCGVGM